MSLYVPLTEETEGMMGADRLGQLKPTCRLINTCRGAVLDEAALAEALDAKVIAGAAIDVFSEEPVPPHHPLEDARELNIARSTMREKRKRYREGSIYSVTRGGGQMHYRLDEMTWPEVDEAARAGRIPVLPVGSVEQHGPHLPLKTDWFACSSIAEEAARSSAGALIAMPPVHYGLVPHVMDFPGTITANWITLVDYCLGVTKSLEHHGFKRIIVLNGHGSNRHLLEAVARRTVLETDALCAVTSWWDLLRVDKDFEATWRESIFPGGCGHACELETSLLLHLDADSVQEDKIEDSVAPFDRFTWVDLFEAGPVTIPGVASRKTGTGVGGEPSRATAEKGRIVFEEAVTQLIAFSKEFTNAPDRPPRSQEDRLASPSTYARPAW